MNEGVWKGLHEFQHAFMDSGSALVKKKAITQPQLDHINDYIRCMNKIQYTSDNSKDVISIMQKAGNYYDHGDIEGLGECFAELNLKLCGDQMMYSHD